MVQYLHVARGVHLHDAVLALLQGKMHLHDALLAFLQGKKHFA